MAEQAVVGSSPASLRRVLVPLALAQFICSFAGSNMNVMINDMSKDLNTTVQGIQVAITIFLLVMAALMIPGGKLTERYGRVRLFRLGLVVYGVLRSGTWGFVQPKPDAPTWLGLSPVIWLLLAGGAVLLGFLEWEKYRRDHGRAALLDPAMLRVKLLRSGLTAFFFQYLLQAGLFFAVPLFLSIALGLSAIDTGLRIMPLSITLVIAAVGIPKLFPKASPRRVTRFGFLMLFLGLVVFVALLDEGAGAEITLGPMLLAGLGIGALASQLGAVTVSAVPDDQAPEVGGIQNTMTNLGASIGTALAGSILIAALSSAFLTNIEASSAIPSRVTSDAKVQLAGGVPFISDADLEKALDAARVNPRATDAAMGAYRDARITGLRSALAILGVMAILSLFFAGRIPTRQPGAP